MIKNSYELEILVNGRSIKEYLHEGKTYIEGRKNSVFTLRIRNNSYEKVLFVPTIDGLSVIDGTEGSFNSRGYIVDGHSSVAIDGWRLSNDKVAEFYFSSPEKSYRNKQQKGLNLGSIGVAVFREKTDPFVFRIVENTPKRWPLPIDPYFVWSTDKHPDLSTTSVYMCSASNSSLSGQSAMQSVGTGFGSTKNSHVTNASFNREEKPLTVLELFYNTREQLQKLGINFNTKNIKISEPNSFPAEQTYCKRPRN